MTHGRIQNAGIVRKKTPKVKKKYEKRPTLPPRSRYKKKFMNRHLKEKPVGQNRLRKN
ncbi:MAG: 30S ribosomal protein S30e [Candidatus Heimdallarchaeota archaeon]|nr:30S ribosomal protein S30e [Candidatus Heimdallarchaeota archaeon]